MMAKTLELIFLTDQNKTVKVAVDEPKEPIDIDAAKAVMDTVIAHGALEYTTGKPVEKKEVRLVERNVQEYSM